MASIAELERQRRELNRKIAAARARRKAPERKRRSPQHIIRKKYPSFARSMDNAAKQMWG